MAQLHVRLDADGVTPKTRAATTSWSALLAEAGRKSIGPTGTIETRLTPESLVISFGVEAARVDDALRAIDAALRARGNRPPSTPVPAHPTLQVVDDVVDADAARALFPGLPIALPVDGAALDPPSAKALGDAMSPDRLAVVVVGPDTGDALLARTLRAVTAPLPKPQPRTAPTLPTAGKTIHEQQDGTRSSSSLTSLIPPRQDAAGLMVLAELLGGRFLRSSVAAGVVVDVTAPDRVSLLGAEDTAVEQIRRVAAAAPPPEVVDAARDRVLTARLSSLNDPARVAHALGQAILDGHPTRVEDEIAALASLPPIEISLAAAALQSAFVVVARTMGGEPSTSASPPAPTP